MALNLKHETLNWALAHHERFGDTDIFPTPFEYEAIRHQWSFVLPRLAESDLLQWRTSAYRRALTPKSRFGFRTATQLDPLDSLVFSGLVYEIARDLERARDPSGHLRVFGHRVKRDSSGQLYDPASNFDAFSAHLTQKTEEYGSGWVVVTDIADFYSRIYHHPLENILHSATTKSDHVDAIMRLLSQWNYTVSSGIPVGPAASRILAEMALIDVDRTLSDLDIDYCRFSDDFRIFARTEAEAHNHLSTLASALGESHLTLSERKTTIIPAQRYAARHLRGERPDDAATLAGRVARILERYGYENDVYSTTEMEDLPPEMIRELDQLDLNRVLLQQTEESHSYDIFIVSLALRRLAQIRDSSLRDVVVNNLHQFTPVFPQTIRYFEKVTAAADRELVGSQLISAVIDGASGHRTYQQAWVLDLCARDPAWAMSNELLEALEASDPVVVRPTIIRSLGLREQAHWFRQRRRDAQNLAPWEQRAFIIGATCLQRDEYAAWLRSLSPRLDLLAEVVARYGRAQF